MDHIKDIGIIIAIIVQLAVLLWRIRDAKKTERQRGVIEGERNQIILYIDQKLCKLESGVNYITREFGEFKAEIKEEIAILKERTRC